MSDVLTDEEIHDVEQSLKEIREGKAKKYDNVEEFLDNLKVPDVPDPRIEPYVSSEDGELWDISFNHGDVSFTIIELTEEEIERMIQDIRDQVFLLKESYEELRGDKNE